MALNMRLAYTPVEWSNSIRVRPAESKTNMIIANTCLRNSNGSFFPIDENSVISDDRYIEGGIELTIDGVAIIDFGMWDYVDQLWSYIAHMMNEVINLGRAETYFPDQPITLSFEAVGNTILVTSDSSRGIRTASADRAELLQALGAAGTSFFTAMIRLAPANEEPYSHALTELQKALATAKE